MLFSVNGSKSQQQLSEAGEPCSQRVLHLRTLLNIVFQVLKGPWTQRSVSVP